MKVWVLSSGCRYEGGGSIAVFGSEESGLKGAAEYMQKEIDSDNELKNHYHKHEVFFVKEEQEDGHYCWIKHTVWQHNGESEIYEADHDYVALTWYELQ